MLVFSVLPLWGTKGFKPVMIEGGKKARSGPLKASLLTTRGYDWDRGPPFLVHRFTVHGGSPRRGDRESTSPVRNGPRVDHEPSHAWHSTRLFNN